ncbi:zinc-dependent alcohol dehydrogenase [Phaeobacter sp. C3_T13_0]|uniref:zinc-dependent alcohol dehydrogenase n=1 Tax=Phaeobacter cretensis TaxID=3342641 RepID=UPI0039BC8C87
MKALVYTGPEQLSYLDVPPPTVGEGDHLVRVCCVGICGSDMHAYLGHDDRRPAPLILGHEVAGVIEGGPRDGERVTVNPLVTCGTCPACREGYDNLCPKRQIISMPPREGGFAEFLAIPGTNLVKVPDTVSLSQAALAEPIACGWHTVRRSLAVLYGAHNRALVLGGGAIGLGAALSLKAQGIDDVTIVEPNPARRTYLIDVCSQTVLETAPENGLFDLVIDGVGYTSTRAAASACVRPGGVIGHIGLGEDQGGLDIRRMTLQEVTFVGTYTYTAEDFRQTAHAIFEQRLGALDWTDHRSLADGGGAFEDIRNGAVAEPKILLVPTAAPERN